MTECNISKKMRDALVCLGQGPQTVYEIAGSLFNEKYGLMASRAGGRLQCLKRMGLAANDGRVWRVTDAGRAALALGEKEPFR